MVYDYTGSWNPSQPGQHSSYNHAERGINYWKNIVGIAGEKLTLGVPFYGYNFLNSTTVESFTYGSMVASNTSNSEREVGKHDTNQWGWSDRLWNTAVAAV